MKNLKSKIISEDFISDFYKQTSFLSYDSFYLNDCRFFLSQR